jgi:hypothetical protein
VRVIREYDASNTLTAAGYEWGEPDDARAILFLAVLAITAGLALLAADMATKSAMAIPLCGLAAASAWTAYALYKHRFRKRALIFRSDGRIEAPRGVPDTLWPRYRIAGHHGYILNIAKLADHEPGGRTRHRTALYAMNGNIVRVTGDVHPDAAHRVAAQLTAALQDIRTTTGWSADVPVKED